MLKDIQNALVRKVEELKNPGQDIGIFAIKDEKTGEFHPPFFQKTPQAAIRLFKTEINRAHDNNHAYLYPEDFQLYYLGTFNQVTGAINPEITAMVKGPAVKT